MPAPTPINIRYGSALDLGQLASAAGAASYGLSERNRQAEQQRQQYEMWLQQRAQDMQFLTGEMNRRSAETMQRNSLMANGGASQEPTLVEAAGYAPRRAAAQSAGAMGSARGRAASPVSLQAEQAAAGGGEMTLVENQPGGSGYFTEGGRTYRVGPREADQAGPNPTPRPGQVQDVTGTGGFMQGSRQIPTGQGGTQLEYLKAMQGQIPDDDWNALWVAAQSGQLKMDQLVDDVRAAKAKTSGRMTAGQRTNENLGVESQQLQQVAQLGRADQVAYARRKYGMQDPDIYSDDDALNALQSRVRQVAAFTQPVTNSSGQSPTGGNPIRVNSPEEARRLPSGTLIQDPQGNIRRVP